VTATIGRGSNGKPVRKALLIKARRMLRYLQEMYLKYTINSTIYNEIGLRK
jgi:hypothetical protein